MRRHVDVKYPPSIVAQNDQHEKDPEGCGRTRASKHHKVLWGPQPCTAFAGGHADTGGRLFEVSRHVQQSGVVDSNCPSSDGEFTAEDY